MTTPPKPQSDFFGLRPPRHVELPPPNDNATVVWKDIKPDNGYENIRKMFQQQKKRKYTEFKRQQQEKKLIEQGRGPGERPPSKIFRANNVHSLSDIAPKKQASITELSLGSRSSREIPSSIESSGKGGKKTEEDYRQLMQQVKENSILHHKEVKASKEAKEEEKKVVVVDKVPNLFLQEVNQNLDKESINLFKEALRAFKSGGQIDALINDILKAFFKSSLGIAFILFTIKYIINLFVYVLSDEKNPAKLREMIQEVPNFKVLKGLAKDVAIYIGKKQRDHFYSVIDKFIAKHEIAHCGIKPQSKPGSVAKPQQLAPEIVQEDVDKIRCCICYEANDLYVSKCKHVACLSCWTQWLEKTLECPACRTRTRKNQIFPMDKEDSEEITLIKVNSKQKPPQRQFA